MSTDLRLAWQLLRREWLRGELRLLLIALTIAVSASATVGFFTDRVERALIRQASEFLGADLVLRSARPFHHDLAAEAQQRQLQLSEQLLFPSMVMHEERMLLASIKAVDDHYPLKGRLELITSAQTAPVPYHQAPSPGQAWVERRVLESLKLVIGDSLVLGNTELQIGAIIQREPDRGGGLYNLRPRVLIHRQDLADAGLIQPGSRVSYRYLFNGPEAPIKDFKRWLQQRLQPGQRLLDIGEENPSLNHTLTKAKRYLNLSGLLAVLMASAAIIMAIRRYTERHFDSAALLRCLGQPQHRITRLFALQLLIAGALATLCGATIGWLAQYGLVALFDQLVPGTLPGPGWQPLLTAAGSGLLVLMGFSLPPLLRLGRVSPLRVLRRELDPLPNRAWLVYLLSTTLLIVLLWLYSKDLKLTLLISLGGTISSAVLALIGWGLIKSCRHLSSSLSWQLALTNMTRRPAATLAQLIAFSLTLAAMALLLLVRSDLINSWQRTLPEDAPNYFLINIQPHEVEPLRRFFDQHQLHGNKIYPMVRGRLSHINDASASQLHPPNTPGHRAIRRELNLTFSSELSEDNQIVAGRWWQPEDHGQTLISVEHTLAADLGVDLGDRLRFSFGEQQLDAKIVSLRRLEWGSMRPNFYVIFSPGSLDQLPVSYITSFHLSHQQRALLQQLVEQFPTLTLLEVEQILGNIRQIVAQVSLAVEYVLLFVLAAGITVLFSALASSLSERIHEGAMLRTLGAQSRLLKRMIRTEFALLGACSGLCAALLVELLRIVLYRMLSLDYSFEPLLWLGCPIAGVLLVVLAAKLGTRSLISHSPLQVLRQD